MSKFREYSTRLETVGSMRRVTSTMKMVSASHLHRAQGELKLPDPLRAALLRQWSLLKSLDFAHHRVCQTPPARDSKVLMLIITANRGLCGSFNHSIVRSTREWVKQHARQHSLPPQALYIGMKGYQMLHHEIAECLPPMSTPAYPKARDSGKLCGFVVDNYLNGVYDEIWLSSNRFHAVSDVRPHLRRLLPLRPERIQRALDELEEEVKVILEPADDRLIDALIYQWIHLDIYSALLHSIASEHASRVIAMENATFNLTNMGTELTLLRNQARQATITNELTEIVSGAESLE